MPTKPFRIINITPLFVEHTDAIVEDLCRLESDIGITDVAFMCPLNPEGQVPSQAKATHLRDRFLRIRESLRAAGSRLNIGILLQSLIGHGTFTETPFQRIIKSDASSTHRVCPLDTGFQAHIRDVIATIAGTRPAFLLVDDDFRIFSGGYGCFCPLHLNAFNQQTHGSYDRKSLWAVLQKTDAKSCRIGDQWTALLTSSLMELATIIRQAIDTVDPAMPCGYCAAVDGPGTIPLAAPIARALAGGTSPFVRLNNSWYLGNDARGLLNRLYHTAALMDGLRDIPDVLSETDTYPHNRYSTPARALHAHLVFSLLHGVSGAKLWISRIYGYEPDSGDAYRQILRTNRGSYQALFDLMPSVTWDEPATPLPHKPVSPWNPADYGKDRMSTWATYACGHMGIPCRVARGDDAAVVMLTGAEVSFFSDDELRGFLSKGVLLDGVAAEQLTQRGFAELLGVEVTSFDGQTPDIERLTDHPINGVTAGRQITQTTFYGGANRQIRICAEGVETLSTLFHVAWYLQPDPVAAGPGVTLFENRLGGRVAVYAAILDGGASFLSRHVTFLNESRRLQLIAVLDWLQRTPLPVIVVTDVDCYVRHGVSDPAAGGGELLAIFNLNMDPLPELRLRVSGAPISQISRMGGDGTWTALP